MQLTKRIFFFFFFLFGPFIVSNLITLLFLVHFKHFEVLQEHHLKFYKLFWNYNKNIVTYKELFGCSITSICNFWWFVFFQVIDPSYFGGCSFLNYISFVTIFNALDAPIERVQVWFQHPKQWNPPFEFGVPWRLSVQSSTGLPYHVSTTLWANTYGQLL